MAPAPPRDEAWHLDPVPEPAPHVFSVSAHAGRVLVGGRALHVLGAGARGWTRRELPPGAGMAWYTAQEPWAPWRAAVGADYGVFVFDGDDVCASFERDDPVEVEGLAWGRARGGLPALYILWEDHTVWRASLANGEMEALELPPIWALASDEGGAVAMMSWSEGVVYATSDGERLSYRSLDLSRAYLDALPDEIEDGMHLAVASRAVAVSIGCHGAFLTRDLEALPFEACEPLASAGALAFEGASPDAALFGALSTWDRGAGSVVRVDADGSAVRFGELRTGAGMPLFVEELAWDATRRTLFGVHGHAGVVMGTAPGAKLG